MALANFSISALNQVIANIAQPKFWNLDLQNQREVLRMAIEAMEPRVDEIDRQMAPPIQNAKELLATITSGSPVKETARATFSFTLTDIYLTLNRRLSHLEKEERAKEKKNAEQPRNEKMMPKATKSAPRARRPMARSQETYFTKAVEAIRNEQKDNQGLLESFDPRERGFIRTLFVSSGKKLDQLEDWKSVLYGAVQKMADEALDYSNKNLNNSAWKLIHHLAVIAEVLKKLSTSSYRGANEIAATELLNQIHEDPAIQAPINDLAQPNNPFIGTGTYLQQQDHTTLLYLQRNPLNIT